MPAWLGWFAEHQPFTPIIDPIRGLLLGISIGNSGALAVGWCLLLTAIGYAWSKSLFAKERIR